MPTLQHVARHCAGDADAIRKSLVRLALRPPNFNYELLVKLARDLLLYNHPYDEIVAAVQRIKRPDLRDKYLEILPLLHGYFKGQQPNYFQDVEPRYYSVGRSLKVPFAPPFIYGIGGKLYFPWLSFWRSNPLCDDPLSLFVTLVESILLDDPDLEDAQFDIVDFSSPKPKSERMCRVISAADVPRLSEARVRNMLDEFAEGFCDAERDLAAMPSEPPKSHDVRPQVDDPEQSDLFDDPDSPT